MELRHLRYFVAVAAHGSFNRAAEILHLTQPALSRQVKDLEEELGVPLLVRGQNMVKLTESGDLFYEEAREVIARAHEAVQRVRGQARSETLRVGYAPSIIAGVMSAVLEKFQSATPRVRIELTDLSSREINELAGRRTARHGDQSRHFQSRRELPNFNGPSCAACSPFWSCRRRTRWQS